MITGADVTVAVATITGREWHLARFIQSVKEQTVQPADIAVYLDGDRRGPAFARNQALAQVETDWVAFSDDDDEFLPNHLEVLLDAANGVDADLFFTYPEVVGDRDPLACWDDQYQIVQEPIDVPFGEVQATHLRAMGNFIPIQHLARTAQVREAGGFPAPFSFKAPNSHQSEDYGLLLHMLDNGARFHHVCGVRTWRWHIAHAAVGSTRESSEVRRA